MKYAIKTPLQHPLLQEGPTSLQNDLEDLKIEETDRRKMIFYKKKNYIPRDQEL